MGLFLLCSYFHWNVVAQSKEEYLLYSVVVGISFTSLDKADRISYSLSTRKLGSWVLREWVCFVRGWIKQWIARGLGAWNWNTPGSWMTSRLNPLGSGNLLALFVKQLITSSFLTLGGVADYICITFFVFSFTLIFRLVINQVIVFWTFQQVCMFLVYM